MIRPRGKNGILHFKHRVPKRFAEFHASPFVEVSLMTDSRAEAEAKADAYWGEMVPAIVRPEDGIVFKSTFVPSI